METLGRKKLRISGHESFPCRYAWLPKIVRLVQNSPAIFSDDDKVMVELGLGKNMVRSARFWAQAAGIISASRSNVQLTPFGEIILGKNKYDPYLEDVLTLWLLHWQLATNMEAPLLAWDHLFGKWQEPEMVSSNVIKHLLTEVSRYDDGPPPSQVTIQQHFEVFLHTYLPTRTKKGNVQEDNLDCPLVELELLQKIGYRESAAAKGEREPVYAFRYEDKQEITPELFAYCIADYWQKKFPNENTLAFRDIAHGPGGPGRVFKLPEDAIRVRLEGIRAASLKCFAYAESAQIQQLQKTGKPIDMRCFLERIYTREASNV